MLNIISSDYKIEFHITLYQSKPIVSVTSELNSEIIEAQILNHLKSGAISIFLPVDGQHVYRVFIVEKSNGKDHLTLARLIFKSENPLYNGFFISKISYVLTILGIY